MVSILKQFNTALSDACNSRFDNSFREPLAMIDAMIAMELNLRLEKFKGHFFLNFTVLPAKLIYLAYPIAVLVVPTILLSFCPLLPFEECLRILKQVWKKAHGYSWQKGLRTSRIIPHVAALVFRQSLPHGFMILHKRIQMFMIIPIFTI